MQRAWLFACQIYHRGREVFITEEGRFLSQRKGGFITEEGRFYHSGSEVLSQRERGFFHRGREVFSQRMGGFITKNGRFYHREWELLQGEVCYTLFCSVGNYINHKQRINLNNVPSLNPPLAE